MKGEKERSKEKVCVCQSEREEEGGRKRDVEVHSRAGEAGEERLKRSGMFVFLFVLFVFVSAKVFWPTNHLLPINQVGGKKRFWLDTHMHEAVNSGGVLEENLSSRRTF